MKKMFTVLAVLVAAAVVLVACGGGGGGASGPAVTAPSTPAQSQQAASSAYSGANMAGSSSQMFQNFGDIGISSTIGAPVFKMKRAASDPGQAIASRLSAKFAKSRSVAKATQAARKARSLRTDIPPMAEPCYDGGTMTIGGSVDATGTSFTMTVDFAQCRENGTVMNGPMTVTGTAGGTQTSIQLNLTEQLGNNTTKLSILEFSDYTYSLMVAKMEAAMTLGTSGNVTLDNMGNMVSATASFSGNGTIDVMDYFSLFTYNMTYTNNVASISATAGTGNVDETDTISMSGAFSETWTANSVTNSIAMSYSGFTMTDAMNVDGSADSSINGSFSINFTPDDCFEGGYSFVTNTPIHTNSSGMTTAGKLTINTSTEVIFNSDGTVTVNLIGGSSNPVYTGDLYGLTSVCDFQTLDNPTPTSQGNTGSTTGSTMTITLGWNNPSGTSASDMDLHLAYFSTTPTAGAVPTATVNYVTSGSGYPVDLNNDGTTDAELDFDDTDGYGPEHITASSLPAGYYIVSVDSYALHGDMSSNVSVSIQVGGSVFGPFTKTFVTDDFNGTDYTNSWFRVADLVVDGAGNVTVQAPNTSVNPAAPGMRVPKAR